MTRPDPLGIEPRFIWVERRRDALLAAMKRYEAGNHKIPAELTVELDEHLRWLEEQSKQKRCDVAAQESLLIAIDFDQTFTSDESLWKGFIANAEQRGHKVICVTARRNTFEHRKFVAERLPESVDAYFAYDWPKRDFITSVYKLWPDIWIDDIPEGI